MNEDVAALKDDMAEVKETLGAHTKALDFLVKNSKTTDSELSALRATAKRQRSLSR